MVAPSRHPFVPQFHPVRGSTISRRPRTAKDTPRAFRAASRTRCTGLVLRVVQMTACRDCRSLSASDMCVAAVPHMKRPRSVYPAGAFPSFTQSSLRRRRRSSRPCVSSSFPCPGRHGRAPTGPSSARRPRQRRSVRLDHSPFSDGRPRRLSRGGAVLRPRSGQPLTPSPRAHRGRCSHQVAPSPSLVNPVRA